MKPYPNVNNYDSDYDYYLDCINYSESSVKKHFDGEITNKIQNFESEIEDLISMYDYSIDDGVLIEKIKDLLYEAYETARECKPTKLNDL